MAGFQKKTGAMAKGCAKNPLDTLKFLQELMSGIRGVRDRL